MNFLRSLLLSLSLSTHHDCQPILPNTPSKMNSVDTLSSMELRGAFVFFRFHAEITRPRSSALTLKIEVLPSQILASPSDAVAKLGIKLPLPTLFTTLSPEGPVSGSLHESRNFSSRSLFFFVPCLERMQNRASIKVDLAPPTRKSSAGSCKETNQTLFFVPGPSSFCRMLIASKVLIHPRSAWHIWVRDFGP